MLQHGTMALAAIAKPYECRCSLVLLDVEARRGGLIGPNILYESQISGAGASWRRPARETVTDPLDSSRG